ncbi:hypothetical protein BXZ70DRAFT_1012357 [Cristinia sonorae]|uniref:NACHT domain-containing protein n=1 Tax=Cristinia sonorae TaxID=1940300 RepID=A0A8K0XKY6_9AGAR|nr:hypothetical protein BXZ70DRAFT_1012357 [Cristinia sonorae]
MQWIKLPRIEPLNPGRATVIRTAQTTVLASGHPSNNGSSLLGPPQKSSPSNRGSSSSLNKRNDSTVKIDRVLGLTRYVLDIGAIAAEFNPIAKAVVAGVTKLLKVAEGVRENKHTIGTITTRLEHLINILGTDPTAGAVFDSVNNGRFEKMLDQLEEMDHQGLLRSVVGSASDTDKKQLEDMTRDIHAIITEFQLKLQLEHRERLLEMRRCMEEVHGGVKDAEAVVVLSKLKHSEDAAYEKGQQETMAGKRTACLIGTRMEVLKRLEVWVSTNGDHRVYWLNGMAGTGKSTIADSLVQFTFTHGLYGASFFCSRDFESARNVHLIFPTIAHELAHTLPSVYRDELLKFLKSRANPTLGSLEQQLTNLILEPLQKVSHLFKHNYTIIIDALDECDNDHVRPLPFIVLLLKHVEDFTRAELRKYQDRLDLHDEPLALVARDIWTYTQARLHEIYMDHAHEDPPFWYTNDEVATIVEHAGALFIFAATLCKFINSCLYFPRRHLDQLLTELTLSSSGTSATQTKATQHLDLLYRHVLSEAIREDDEDKDHVLFVVASVLLLSQPLSCGDLAALLGGFYTFGVIQALLKHLRSVIAVPADLGKPVRAFHASFEDYVTTRGRADDRFYIDPASHHAKLALRCFTVMSTALTEDNICRLPLSVHYSGISDLKEHCSRYIPHTLAYASYFWVDHLAKVLTESSMSEDLAKALHVFLTKNLLRWINLLATSGKLDRCIPMLAIMRKLLLKYQLRDHELFSLIYDAERLVDKFYDLIHDFTMQVYISALPFVPRNTSIYK